jgi:hypothetical protein
MEENRFTLVVESQEYLPIEVVRDGALALDGADVVVDVVNAGSSSTELEATVCLSTNSQASGDRFLATLEGSKALVVLIVDVRLEANEDVEAADDELAAPDANNCTGQKLQTLRVESQ